MPEMSGPHFDAAALVSVIANAIEDAVISTDNEGTITSWNGGAERIYGYSEAQAIGQPIRLIIPADQAAEELEVRHRAVEGDPARDFDTLRTRSDGSTVAVSVFITRILDADGNVAGTLRIARDVGGRRIEE